MEGHLLGTHSSVSMSPSAGPVPAVTWASSARRTRHVTSLVLSAAFGLVDHSHLDAPGLNLLAFKTPTAPLGSCGLSSLSGYFSAVPVSVRPVPIGIPRGFGGHQSACLPVSFSGCSTLGPILHPAPACARSRAVGQLPAPVPCLLHQSPHSERSQKHASSPHLRGRQDTARPGFRQPYPCSPWCRDGPRGRPGWRVAPGTQK